ncbi:hypothetical protein PYW07_013463 [Mythimna separata]|uniref:Uncharacterized protein n=1 Tax=Mythimna separata TaxID=271217 RepID=A0AAD8DKA0_MYTSE|nr:hypothetical protein PYW07_013463 [Mythimna separata]
MAVYQKRPGTTGLSGQLYETRLISLFYLRALHDDTIEEFQIGANVYDTGRFDDICLKAKIKECGKPVAMFIQVKHRFDETRAVVMLNDLFENFKSYLKIRQKFDPDDKDSFFSGRFEDTDCLFVIYTNARIGLTTTSEASVGSLIGTGGTVSQLCNQEEHVKLLCGASIKEDMIHLADCIARCINGEIHAAMPLSSETVLRYHVILAQRVVDVSDIQPDGYRVASFRDDFFDANEEYLTIFKHALINELAKKRKIDPHDLEQLLYTFSAEPTDIVKLSKLIGTAVTVTHRNGQLRLEIANEQNITNKYILIMTRMCVSLSTIEKAVDLAAREILTNLSFKVPAEFGNKDLTLRGSDKVIERKIHSLVMKIQDLLEDHKLINMDPIVTVDDSLVKGFLIRSGVAGAIGNIFVLDDDPKLMKITDNCEQLGPMAKKLYLKLHNVVPNLLEYKFYFKVYAFPKLSIDYNSHDSVVKDYLNRLLFLQNQANVDSLEQILKKEIGHYQVYQSNYFQASSDAILSKYHDKVQKWWMQSGAARYLTREPNNIFQKSISSIIKDPQTSEMHALCMIKIKQYKYKFNEDAVRSLNLKHHLTTIVTAEDTTLTVIKVMQHLNNKEHVVLDVSYIANLQPDERYTLRKELIKNDDKIVILICNDLQQCEDDKQQEKKDIIEIVTVRHKNNIIVTNRTSDKILKNYFPKADKIVHDKRLCLLDVCADSQERILGTATATFPGVDLKLGVLLKGWPMPCSR